MANLSDMIEEYLLSIIGRDASVSISRNKLATHFCVSPSQINYVLSTRFTMDRGFVIESKRGGGGYLNIIKVCENCDNYIMRLINDEIGDTLTYQRAMQIVKKLYADEFLTLREMEIILSCINEKAFLVHNDISESVRASMLKSMLATVLKINGGEL